MLILHFPCEETESLRGSVPCPRFSSVQSLSHVRHFMIPWTAARWASLSITNSWSLLKFMSIESVMPSNHLILCRPLLLPPSIFPSIRVFSNELVLCIRQPKYWSFSFSIRSFSETDSLGPHGLHSSQNSPGQHTGMGSLFLLQGIFPTWGSNPGLLHCRQTVYCMSHKGSPFDDQMPP